MDPHQPATHTADQRRSPRRPVEAPVRMTLDAGALAGVSDNVSGIGLMFFSEEPLRVTVELQEDGETKTYQGRLVRAQRMNETTTGYAIEFDPQ